MLPRSIDYPNLKRYLGYPIAVAMTNDGRFTPMIGYACDTGFQAEPYCLPQDPIQSYSTFQLAWQAAQLAIDEIHQLLETEKHTEQDQDYAGVKLLPEVIVELTLAQK